MRAIVTHPDAQLTAPNAGKLAEPVLFMTRQLRAIGGNVADYPFLSDLSVEMGQRIFHSPSVFNYYSPNFRIPGTQLTGPEFQLYTTATGMIRANFVAKLISGGFGPGVTLNLTPWLTLAADAGALVNRIDVLAMGGTLSTAPRNAMLMAIALRRPRGNKNMKTRRRFIRTCCSLAAAGADRADAQAGAEDGDGAEVAQLQSAGLRVPFLRERREQHDHPAGRGTV